MNQYMVDISANGMDWEEGQVHGDYQMVVDLARGFHEQGWFVNVWDEQEVLVWRDGRIANEYYQLSQFEREWMRVFGSLSPAYQSTVAL